MQKPTTCIGLQADKALSVNIQDTHFSILGVAFAVSFLCYFQKLQLIVVKKLSIFIALYFIFMSSKSVPQIFKILLQTWDTNIFVLGGVFFIRYVQLKSSFSDEKTAVKSETHFSREAIENQQGKVLKKNSIIDRSWSSAKFFIVQDYTENANGDMPLILENKWYLVYLSSSCANVLCFFADNIGLINY